MVDRPFYEDFSSFPPLSSSVLQLLPTLGRPPCTLPTSSPTLKIGSLILAPFYDFFHDSKRAQVWTKIIFILCLWKCTKAYSISTERVSWPRTKDLVRRITSGSGCHLAGFKAVGAGRLRQVLLASFALSGSFDYYFSVTDEVRTSCQDCFHYFLI